MSSRLYWVVHFLGFKLINVCFLVSQFYFWEVFVCRERRGITLASNCLVAQPPKPETDIVDKSILVLKKTNWHCSPTERRPAWCCELARACRRAAACTRTRPPPGWVSAARCTSQHTWTGPRWRQTRESGWIGWLHERFSFHWKLHAADSSPWSFNLMGKRWRAENWWKGFNFAASTGGVVSWYDDADDITNERLKLQG